VDIAVVEAVAVVTAEVAIVAVAETATN
jgi:hypothetical protein